MVCLISLILFTCPKSILARNYGEGTYGTGDFNVGEPTPVPTVNSQQSSGSDNSSSSSNNSQCASAKPGIPDLFQVDVKGTSAKLLFAPLSAIDKYVIGYSSKPNTDEYAVEVNLGHEGVQNYTVNLLKPNTSYYFKIKGINDCMPGDWSNVVKITTKSTSFYKTIVYYKSLLVEKITKIITSSKLTQVTRNKPKATVSVSPEPTLRASIQEVSEKPAKKKFCLLWWCF